MRRLLIAFALLLVSFTVIGQEEPTHVLPEVDPFNITGDIVTAGSSTVFPLAEHMAQLFSEEGYDGTITVDSIGSGAGFERFCVEGESQISNASRPIRESEIEECQAIGRDPIEFRVGTDALAVTVSAENTFVTDVTMEELAVIFGSAELWSDVRSEWPEEPIERFIPGTDSGTFDFFVEVIFDEDEEPILSASNTQLSEDDNVLVQGVESSPYAIGFFGYAYYLENQEVLNILDVNGVTASAESVEATGDEAYPLARPLFMYSDAEIMNENPQVAAFLNYVLTNVNQDLDGNGRSEVVDVGYFPAGVETHVGAQCSWLTAMQIELPAECEDTAQEGDN